jgi:hypothetical protein
MIPVTDPEVPGCEVCGAPTGSKYGTCRKTPECWREYMRRYYAANQETIRGQRKPQAQARRRSYTEADWEKMRAYNIAYRAANQEKMRALSAAYRKANREVILERRRTYDAAYRVANRETKKEQNAAYHRAHRAGRANRKNARRARMAAQTDICGPVSQKVYEAVRASGPCVYCGQEATTVDHVRPLVKGGWEHESNLVPACAPCNFSKGPRLLTEWRRPERVAYGIEHSPKVAAEYERLQVLRARIGCPDGAQDVDHDRQDSVGSGTVAGRTRQGTVHR